MIRKILIFVVLSFISLSFGYAQANQEPLEQEQSTPIAKRSFQNQGTVMVNLGFQAGVFRGYGITTAFLSDYRRTGSFIPLQLSVDYGIQDDISVGGYLGYYSVGWRRRSNDDFSRSNVTAIGFRGTYHFGRLLDEHLSGGFDTELFDIYVTANIGADIIATSSEISGFPRSNTEARLTFAPVLGLRYLMSPNLAIFVEGGRSVFGAVHAGVTFRL
ncbi:MAG: hypothetical protein LAT68_06745 [Cyclobacteriaceae bacterium]|nr:hypothetical protein [Cyclobacteriaceae bacterium]MCH8516010.1 hypothetical protein [Cyclobacteriaceae bacterium]